MVLVILQNSAVLLVGKNASKIGIENEANYTIKGFTINSV
jgi:hypothetical protein